MIVENLLSHQLSQIGCLFMFVYSFIVVNKNYCNLKDIGMSISPTEDIALLAKIFMGKANLVKCTWFVKYFFNVFAI